MLMRTDPFQVLEKVAQQFFGTGLPGQTAMPLDAYRDGGQFVVHFDLPGVSPESIDVDVQRDVVTVKAQRTTTADDSVEMVVRERPAGTFTRQLFLGDSLDTGNIKAAYDAGVLTLRIPVAEKAKPRRITITSGKQEQKAINA